MSDRIEIEECIVSKMATVGTLVSRGDLTRENPLLVMPLGETNVVFHLATYERFNGAYVLSIALTPTVMENDRVVAFLFGPI